MRQRLPISEVCVGTSLIAMYTRSGFFGDANNVCCNETRSGSGRQWR